MDMIEAPLLLALAALACQAPGAPPRNQASAQVLIRNARVFDGKSDALSEPLDVLVEGNRITRLSKEPLSAPGATLVEASGRVLMPGLIDAHAHVMIATLPQMVALTADLGYVHHAAGRTAEAMLLRGFTSVRDMGGPSFGLKRAIDEGLLVGPRIYPSGAFVSQTGGHGDFRMPHEVPKEPGAPLSYSERIGFAALADGADAVLLRVREQLRQGASQIKLMAGGGVASAFDPLDVTQYTEAELRAAVQAAENWGTYVSVHAYTPRAIQLAVAAGVKCIEHGQLMDEATARLLAEKGVWLCLQPFLDDEDSIPMPGPNRAKQLEMSAGTASAYALAKKHGVKLAFGTDTLFDPKLAALQGKQLAKLARWFTPAEVLRMATSVNAELLALSGPRNPYPGKLGVIAEGALADLLLVDGNPLEEIGLIATPETSFVLIMKDGKVVKNLLR